MKRIVLSTVVLTALGAAGTATAADMARPAPAAPVYRAPPPAPLFNWSGVYIGAFVGGAWAPNVHTDDPTQTVSNGVLPIGFPYDCPASGAPFFGAVCADNYRLDPSITAGGTIGANWQAAGSPLVVGVEAEGGYLRLKGSGVDNFTAGLPCSLTGPFTLPPSQCNTFFHTSIGDWYGALTARFGVAADHVLIYGKIGGSYTRVKVSAVDECTLAPCGAGLLNATGQDDVLGLAAGGGIEVALTWNWFLKAEYLYIGIDREVEACGTQTNPAVPASFGATFCSRTEVNGLHTGKLGLNYRF